MELVAPGGSLEKIEYAYHYGADAVYVGLPDFSLRARINEFTPEKLEKAVKLARNLNKKIYFTLNIYAHERHLKIAEKHLKFVAKIKPDAIIVSDPGIINLAKKIAPKSRIHLSTQANTTNSEAVRFWQKQGVKRIILAREVTLEEIKKIRKACPKMELEYFVHGAMCMSLSGRCLLSSWMRGRSANLGDCVQPCRWPYRPASPEFSIFPPKARLAKGGNFQFPNKAQTSNSNDQKAKKIILEEDEHGTYFLNSKDLCLIEYINELAKAGVDSFKIEGRTKSVYYVACAVKAYRNVLDAIKSGKSRSEIKKNARDAKKELEKLVNRGYSTGFLLGKDKWENDLEKSHKKNEWQFVGEIMEDEGNRIMVRVHNALKEREKIEIITPEKIYSDKVLEIRNIGGEKSASAHGGGKSIYFLKLKREYPVESMIRKKL